MITSCGNFPLGTPFASSDERRETDICSSPRMAQKLYKNDYYSSTTFHLNKRVSFVCLHIRQIEIQTKQETSGRDHARPY